jgi:hypothetical protein
MRKAFANTPQYELPSLPLNPVSPCTKLCKIDPHSGLCRGGARRLDEIAQWGQMTAAEKHNLIAKLATRRRAET